MGSDPEDLEELARTWSRTRTALGRAKARLNGADRRSWSGPAATGLWGELEQLASLLGERSVAARMVSHQLLDQAARQRVASAVDHVTITVEGSSDGDGRWVGWLGPEDASVVVVVVPGVGNDITDRSALERDARRLHERLVVADQRVRGGHSIATVAWLGYDTPDNVVAGLRRGPANDGAQRLAAHVERWLQQPGRRVVVVGHSYGALVVAEALSLGMQADDAVFLGAPGMGAGGEVDASAAGTRLWSAASVGDPVSLLARLGVVHGDDPVGRTRLLPTSIDGHSSYLRDPVLIDALASVALRPPRSGTVHRAGAAEDGA